MDLSYSLRKPEPEPEPDPEPDPEPEPLPLPKMSTKDCLDWISQLFDHNA